MQAMVSGMFGIIAATRSPLPMPAAFKACCSRGDQRPQLIPGHARLRLVLAAEDQRVAASRVPQQVFGEIQCRIGKEPGLEHASPWISARVAPLADDAAMVPDRRPEIGALGNRPVVERIIVCKALGKALFAPVDELLHRRLVDELAGRYPKRPI